MLLTCRFALTLTIIMITKTKTTVRVVSFDNDVNLIPLVRLKHNMNLIVKHGQACVVDYSDAIAIKMEFDSRLSFDRIFIKPLKDGFACMVKTVHPEDEPKRTSEVERINMLAEEWGCSVETLLNSHPHLIEVSSGGTFNRL